MQVRAGNQVTGNTAAGDSRQYIAFELGEHFYGVEITTVLEIRQWSATTELPDQPKFGRGVLDIRGEVVPVYDLRARFGGAMAEVTESHVVLILSIDSRSIGVLVDAVSDIIAFSAAELRPVPDGAHVIEQGAVTNLAAHGKRMIALLDLSVLFGVSGGAPYLRPASNGPATSGDLAAAL